MPIRDGHFKWEASPNLEHHCGTCKIPLHNPRALQTCFGLHVEPCHRFHQQLHFIQKSHECFGCKTMDEMHFKRHGVIARVVKEIKAHDKENTINQPKLERKKTHVQQGEEAEGKAVGGTNTESQAQSVASNEDVVTLTTKKKKAQRRTEKAIEQICSDLGRIEKKDLDFVSEAIHLKVHLGKSSGLADVDDGAGIYGEAICPILVAENIHFSSHQRSKYYGKRLPIRESGEEDEASDEAPPKPLNVATSISGTKKNRVELKTPKASLTAAETISSVNPKIFERLGVVVELKHDTTRKRRDLVAKLASLIKEDLDIVRKEDEDTMMRQASFWRFVSQETLANLVQSHQDYSWATGELKNKEKYGDSLKVVGTPRMEDGLVEADAEGQGVEEALDSFDEQPSSENLPQLVVPAPVLEEAKEEKRHKRLSSQEGFMTSIAKTRSRAKSYSLPPKTPPRAMRVLKIVDTARKQPSSPQSKAKPKMLRMPKTPIKPGSSAKKAKSTRFATTNNFASLGDMEA